MDTARERTIFCLDLDAFFVSVERLLRPGLEGRPVVVGGLPGSRGVVCSASYEARRFGVRSAMPIAEAERRLRGAPDAVFVPVSHEVYELHSTRVRKVLEEELPLVEAASIDEFYADATGLLASRGGGAAALGLAERIAGRVGREWGLPVSIGIATSKLVAKIATDEAKPRGILRVLGGAEAGFLARLPVERIPGVGPKTAPRLHAIGVRAIGDLLGPAGEAAPEWMREAARGLDPTPVAAAREARSIGHEETFERDVGTLEELLALAADLAERVGWRLRAERLAARTVQLKLRYAARRAAWADGALARDTYETITRARTGPPTNDGAELAARARALLREHWRAGEPLRLLGVHASHLSAEEKQAPLFPEERAEAARGERLSASLDEIRARFGFDAIARAGARPRTPSPRRGEGGGEGA